MSARLPVEIISIVFTFFLFFPPNVFAALTITDVSPATINSADDILTISASASGLSGSTQYLQAVLTREGAPTNYLGLTRNLSNEWYLYKPSPTAVDLSNYFYGFTPVGSTWSGQIQAKVDINDDGFSGPGNYILKLIKYISSSGTASNNSFIVSVNVASPGGQTANVPDAATSLPEITFDLDDNFFLGEEFVINLKLNNFDANQEYLLKFRAGTDENSLNKGQTKSGSAFLSDTESWSRFPQIKTNGSGHFEGQIGGRVSEDKDDGKYYVRIRIHKKDADTFHDSGTKNITLAVPPTINLDPITVASMTVSLATSAAVTATSANKFNLILGTSSAATFKSFPSNYPSSQTNMKSTKKPDIVPIVFIITGLVSLFLSMVVLMKRLKIWEKWSNKI